MTRDPLRLDTPRRRGALLSVLALLIAGCDALVPSPGRDFRVRVVGSAENTETGQPVLRAVGRLAVPLQLAVDGCGAFTAAIEGPAGRYDVALAPGPDGTRVATLPVEWIRPQHPGSCVADGRWPIRSAVRLVVTCADAGRTAWADVALAQSVEAYELAAPHVLRFHHPVAPLPGARGPTALRGVIAVGDKLVLTTTTGIRVLSSDGRAIGGADPLPCRLAPASLAIQSGPTQAAIAAGTSVYVFDLSTLE